MSMDDHIPGSEPQRLTVKSEIPVPKIIYSELREVNEHIKKSSKQISFDKTFEDLIPMNKEKANGKCSNLLSLEKDNKNEMPLPVPMKNTLMNKRNSKLITEGFSGLEFTGTAFITFNTKAEAVLVSKQWNLGFFRVFINWVTCLCPCTKKYYRNYKGRYIQVSLAPEPYDIIWDNLGYSTNNQIIRMFVANILIFIIFALSFILIIGMKYLQKSDGVRSRVENGNFLEANLIHTVIGILISAVNSLLNIAIKLMAHVSRYETRTSWNIAVAWKTTISKTFNSCFIVLIANLIHGKDKFQEEFWTESGYASDAYFILMIHFILHPCIMVMNPDVWLKKYFRWKVRKNPLNYTQSEANSHFEGAQPNLSNWYADVAALVNVALFYLPILPIGLVMALISILVSYWVDKYMLFRVFARPIAQDSKLANYMVHSFNISIFVFALSQLLFDWILRNKVSILSWVMFGISLLYILLGSNYIIDKNIGKKRLKIDKEEKACEPYENSREHFV